MQDLAGDFAADGLILVVGVAGFKEYAHCALDEELHFDVGSCVLVIVQEDKLGEGACLVNRSGSGRYRGHHLEGMIKVSRESGRATSITRLSGISECLPSMCLTQRESEIWEVVVAFHQSIHDCHVGLAQLLGILFEYLVMHPCN